MANVVLRNSQKGYDFTVDGHDMAAVSAGVDLHVGNANEGATLVVSMSFVEHIDLAIKADVELDAETSEALIALGWTPPTKQ